MIGEYKNNEEEVQLLINWLKVLSDGYVKPDVNYSKVVREGNPIGGNTTGVVRDTKDNVPYMDAINATLADKFGITVDISAISERRNKYN